MIHFDLEAPTLQIPDWLRVGFSRSDDLGIAHLQIGPLNFVVDAGLGNHASFREALTGALGLDGVAAWLTPKPADDAPVTLTDMTHGRFLEDPVPMVTSDLIVAEALGRSVIWD